MAVDLFVDLDALQQLANRLTSIKDSLDNVKDDLQSYEPALGSQHVADRLDAFVNGWRDGRKKITGNIEKLQQKVAGIAQTYAEQERDLAKSSQQSGQH
ncbi:MAG TPA: hypothetical protein VHO01_07550 [Jatrophihabitans sp.]|nr:hypothetical protein [Jatrophihabitans sp.]